MAKSNFGSTEKSVPFFRIVSKNILLIVLITVLCTLIGAMYGIMFVKPEYTASHSIILRTPVADTSLGPNTTNNASLGKLYMPQVESQITSPKFISRAQEIYKEKFSKKEKILSNSVIIDFEENSLIFSLSYTDRNEEIAKNKLQAIYESASENLTKLYLSEDDTIQVSLIRTNNTPSVSVNNGFMKTIVFGALIGVVLSVIVVIIKYVLDNTIHDKIEFEELTGVNVIAYIDRVKKDTSKTKKK